MNCDFLMSDKLLLSDLGCIIIIIMIGLVRIILDNNLA